MTKKNHTLTLVGCVFVTGIGNACFKSELIEIIYYKTIPKL